MYVSTEKLCQFYDVDKKFFLRRKDSGEFVKNEHFIQQGKTLRWHIEAIKNWWYGTGTTDNDFSDELIDKILS